MMKTYKDYIFWKIARFVALRALDGYRLFISPLLPKSCRFYPSCSQYARLVVLYQNPFFIPAQILYRLLRCQPFCEGGVNYPLVRMKFAPVFRDFKLESRILDSRIIAWFVPVSRKIFYLKGWYLAIPAFRS